MSGLFLQHWIQQLFFSGRRLFVVKMPLFETAITVDGETKFKEVDIRRLQKISGQIIVFFVVSLFIVLPPKKTP